MRKNNKMALRVLSTATFLAMVASCTAPAFAGTYYLENGDITVDAKEDGNHITQGDLYQDHLDEGKTIITDHEDESDTSAVSNTVTINVDDNATGDVTIKDANIDTDGVTNDPKDHWSWSSSPDIMKDGITVDTKKNATANITLDNVTVNAKNEEKGDIGGAGMKVKGDGTTSIELNGNNTLSAGYNHAGLEKDDVHGAGNLIIKDDYNDDGTEKSEEEKKNSPTGSLTATGSGESAGIGSCVGRDTSNIEITGGKIHAQGDDGAGIGSGDAGNLTAKADNIKISGGDITAIGDNSGAGIGSGFQGSSASIEITGGTIHATSDNGAGIGGGETSENASITITGGYVDAKSNYGGAGIGSGDGSLGKLTIDISGDDTTVIGTSGPTWYPGAGIGTGNSAHHDTVDIKIRGGKVEATGATGIGASGESRNAVTSVSISGGKVTAIGNSGGAGIGTGNDNYGDYDSHMTTDITITGGEVTAIGDKGAAGIGNGYHNNNSDTNITITGGTIKAVGGKGAAAIGGGCDDPYDADSVKATVKIDSSNRALKITAIVQGDSKGAIGNGTVDDDDPFSAVDFDDITVDSLGEEHGALVQFMNNYDAATGTGTLYKAIHNKKYIEETYNNPDDDHEWGNPKIIKEAAPGVPGIIRYTCVVDGCGATHDVPYDYKAPEEPGNTPTTPDVKPDTPAAPDAPVQDVTPGTADTTPADGTVLPGNVQNPDVLDAKPEDAPVTPANAVNPAVQNAKALPQTGSNWLAVLGTALSGVAMMAAGFFLDRKRGENR